MAEWVGLAAEWLQPICELIRQDVFGHGYVQIDETPIRSPAPGNGKTKLGYLWTCGAPRGDAIFHWETSRAATCLENLIPADFRGTLQCDGYAAYDCFARRRGGPAVPFGRLRALSLSKRLAGCLAHVRRKFYDAKETAPKVAGWFLQHLQNLYRLEEERREARAGPKPRAVARSSLSPPVMARLHRALMRLKTKRRFLPQSQMGKAIDYALHQWPSLRVMLEDGRVEIDNNPFDFAQGRLWSKTPSARPRLERKTGSSSAPPGPVNAAPSSTPSSRAHSAGSGPSARSAGSGPSAAAAAVSTPSPTCAKCSRDYPR